jgi:hypothetical protein
MLSHIGLNNFYVFIHVDFNTSLNKTRIKLLSILIFAPQFQKPGTIIVNGKNLFR